MLFNGGRTSVVINVGCREREQLSLLQSTSLHHEQIHGDVGNAITVPVLYWNSLYDRLLRCGYRKDTRRPGHSRQRGVLHSLGHCDYDFRLWTGRVIGALEALLAACEQPKAYIWRHMTGDWGELSKADARENDVSVKNGYRILSAYALPSGVRIWIITEAEYKI